jgi:hypothetical protein
MLLDTVAELKVAVARSSRYTPPPLPAARFVEMVVEAKVAAWRGCGMG